jgi:pimeloyl-ACP methyl ester carboxylesterase
LLVSRCSRRNATVFTLVIVVNQTNIHEESESAPMSSPIPNPHEPAPYTVHRHPSGLDVAELGDGPPIVLVHGGGLGGLHSWTSQLELAARWRLVIPWRPGYGGSPMRGGEDFAVDAPLVAELLGDGAHLVAHSYGAVVATLAAAARPGAVRSLTLVETGGSDVARGKPGVDDYERRMGALAAALPVDPEEALRAVFSILDPTIALPSPLPPPLASWAARLPGLRWPWEAVTPIDALVAGGFPILVVSGGQRRMYEEISDALAEALGAERRIVPGGHAVQATGTPFNAVLEDFLARAEAGAGGRASTAA